MQSSKKTFLSLVKLGIGNADDALIPKNVDWKRLEDLAASQGLSAIMVDGIEKLPEGIRPPKMLLLQWKGETLQSYEYRYDLYKRTIAEMAAFYNHHGYRMMVLKGYSCSLEWPKPEHRPCGDIDIWMFGDYQKTDELLKSEKGIDVDDSHEHHTVFYWQDFMVENHYDFIDVHHRKSSPQLESVFKDLGKDDTHWAELNDTRVYLPSPNLHALFLLRHAMEHFASTEVTLRQLLDWAFFVRKHTKEIDWEWLIGVLEEYGMTPAFNLFNAICVEDLGFEASIFPPVQFLPGTKERVLNDILDPEFSGMIPHRLLPRLLFKYKRWKANGWKNELCFKESMWSAFWSGVWGHIQKPKSL